MTNKLTIALCVVAVVATSSSVYLYRELRDEQARSASLDTRIEELERSRRDNIRFRERELSPPAASTADSKSQVATNPPKAEPPFPRRDPPWNDFRGRPNDPQSRAAMLRQQKLRLMEVYPDLAATLHLRPEEVDKLFELLAEQQMKTMDARESLRDNNLSREELADEMRKLAANQNAERDRQIAALLGDAKTQEWKDYEKSLGARSQVRELSTLLASSGMPLRDDQTQTLVNALMAEQSRYDAAPQGNAAQQGGFPNDPNQRTAMLEQNLARQEQRIQSSRDALASYLTAEQLKRYDELNAQQLEFQRANLQRMRERASNTPPNRN